MFSATDIRATFDGAPAGMLYLASRSAGQATGAPQSEATICVREIQE